MGAPAEDGKHIHELSTTAVTRSLNDLHLPTWFGMQAVTIALRTVFMHPLSLAASRKRISEAQDASSLSGVLREAYRGSSGAAEHQRNRIRNVYRGFGIAVFGNIVGEISCLWAVEAVKQEIMLLQGANPHDRQQHMSAVVPAVAGVSGDFAAVILTTPLSIVCDRQITAGYGMAKANPYESVLQTCKTVWNGGRTPAGTSFRRGLQNMYAGVPASFAMMPAAGVWWASYVEAKFRLYQFLGPIVDSARGYTAAAAGAAHTAQEKHVHSGALALADTNWFLSSSDNPIINGLAGIVASAFTSVVFTPMAVIRTRLQILQPAAAASPRWRITLVVSELYRKEGLRGFYRGTMVNVGMALLDGLAFSTLYEINKLGSDKGLRDSVLACAENL